MGGVKEIKNGFMIVHDNDMGVLNKFFYNYSLEKQHNALCNTPNRIAN